MSEVFLEIFNMSISASYLIAAVVLLRLGLKKAPKWISVALFAVVAVRLVCPFSIESVLSLIPSAQTISPDIMTSPAPEINSGIPVIDNALNPVISDTLKPAFGDSVNPMQIIVFVASVIWLVGVISLTLYAGISYLRIKRRVITATCVYGNVYRSASVGSPFVLGIIKPKIYLPLYIDPRDEEYVIAHERAHIRRRDYLWKPLGFLLLTLHWFNPLVWLGYALLSKDIELACDEKVIKELGEDAKADYSQALLDCSVKRRLISACPLAFGESSVKERIKAVLSYKKPAFWLIAVAIVISIGVSVFFVTDPISEDGDPNDDTVGILPPVVELSPTCSHVEEVIYGRAPSATSVGLTEGKKCSLCGGTIAAQEIIPALTVTDNGIMYRLNNDNSSYAVLGFTDLTATKITVPEKFNGMDVTVIGEAAFKNSATVTEISLPKGIKQIGRSAFEGCVSLESISLPDNLSEMGMNAFRNCRSLRSVDIPNGVKRIENYTFSGCESLLDLKISKSVNYIGFCAFRDCKSLVKVKMPDSVVKTGAGVFDGCVSLESVELSKSITSLEENLFLNCISLKDVEIPNKVVRIGENAFWGCASIEEIHIPASVTELMLGAEFFHGCASLEAFTVSLANPAYKSVDGVLYSKNGDTLIKYPAGKQDKSFEAPQSVTSIGVKAFDNCVYLTEVVLPKSVTSVSNNAFVSCPSLVIKCVSSSKPSGWQDSWKDASIRIWWNHAS